MSNNMYVEGITTKKLQAASIELIDAAGNVINLSGDIDTTNLQSKLNFNGAIVEDAGNGSIGPSPNHIIPSKPNADDVVLCGNSDGTTEWKAAKLNLDTDETLTLNTQTNVIGVNFQHVQEKLTSGRQVTVSDGVVGLNEGFNAVPTPPQAGQVLMAGTGGDLTWTTLTTDGAALYGLSAGPGIKVANAATGDLNQTIISADYNAIQPKLTTGEGLKITGSNLAIKPGYHLVADPPAGYSGDLVLKYKNTSGVTWQPDNLYDSSLKTANGVTGVNFTEVQPKLDSNNMFKIGDDIELAPGYTIPQKPATAGQYLKSGAAGEVLWGSLVSPSVAQKLGSINTGPGITLTTATTGNVVDTNFTIDYNQVQPKLTTNEYFNIGASSITIGNNYALPPKPQVAAPLGQNTVLKSNAAGVMSWQAESSPLRSSSVFAINEGAVEFTPAYMPVETAPAPNLFLKSTAAGEADWVNIVSEGVIDQLSTVAAVNGIVSTSSPANGGTNLTFTVDYTKVQAKLQNTDEFVISGDAINVGSGYIIPPKPMTANMVLKSATINGDVAAQWVADTSAVDLTASGGLEVASNNIKPTANNIIPPKPTAANMVLKSVSNNGNYDAQWTAETVSVADLTATDGIEVVNRVIKPTANNIIPPKPIADNKVLKSVTVNGDVTAQWVAETASANTASNGLEVLNNDIRPTANNIIPPKPLAANKVLKSAIVNGAATAQWEDVDNTLYQPKITNDGTNGIMMNSNNIVLANGYNLVPPIGGQVGKVLKSTLNGVEWAADNVGGAGTINLTASAPLIKTVANGTVNLKIDENSYIPPVPSLTDIHKVIKCTQNGAGVSYGWAPHVIESLDTRLIAANNTINIADDFTLPPKPSASGFVLTSTTDNEAAWTAFTSIAALDNLGTLTAAAPLSVTKKTNPAGDLTGYEFNLTSSGLQEKLTNGQSDKLVINGANKIVPAAAYDLVPVTGGFVNAGKILQVTETGTMAWDNPPSSFTVAAPLEISTDQGEVVVSVDDSHFIPTKPTSTQQVLTTIDGTNAVWSTFATTAAIANLGTLSGTAPIEVNRTTDANGQPNGYNFKLSVEMQPKLTNGAGDKITVNSNKVAIASGYDIIPAASTLLAGKVLKVDQTGAAKWLDEAEGQAAQLNAANLQSLLTGTDITATVEGNKVNLALDAAKWAPLKPAATDVGKALICNSATDYGWKVLPTPPVIHAGSGLEITSNTIKVADTHLLPSKPASQEVGFILKATAGGASWTPADEVKDDVSIINAGLTATSPLEFEAGIAGGIAGGKATIKVNAANIIPPAPTATDNGKSLVCAVNNNSVSVKWEAPAVSNVSSDFKLESGVISVADNKFIPSKTTAEQDNSSSTYFMTSTGGNVGWSVPVSGSELANMGTITGVAPLNVTDELDLTTGTRSLTFAIERDSYMPFVALPVDSTTLPLPLQVTVNGMEYKNINKIREGVVTVKADGDTNRVRIEQSADYGYNLPTYSGNQDDVLKVSTSGNVEWAAIDEPTTVGYSVPHILKSYTNKYGEVIENGSTAFKYDENYKKVTYEVVNNKIETSAAAPFISVIGSFGVDNTILGKDPVYTDSTGQKAVLKNLAHDLDYIYPTVDEYDIKSYGAYPKLEAVASVTVYKYKGYFKETLTSPVSFAPNSAIPDNAILCTDSGVAYTANNRMSFVDNFVIVTISTEVDDSNIRRYAYSSNNYKYPLSYVLGIDIDPSIVNGSNSTHMPKYTLGDSRTGLLKANYNDLYPFVPAALTTANMGPLAEYHKNTLIKYTIAASEKYALTNENGAVESFSYNFSSPYDLILSKYSINDGLSNFSINGNSPGYTGNAAFPGLTNETASLCYKYTSSSIATAVNYSTSNAYTIASVSGRNDVPEVIELKFKRYIGYYKYNNQSGIYVLKANKAALSLIENAAAGGVAAPPGGLPPAGTNGIAINEVENISSDNIIKCNNVGATLDTVPDKYYVKIGLICINGAVPVDPAYASPLLFASDVTYNEINYEPLSSIIVLNSNNKIGDVIMRLPTDAAVLPTEYEFTDNNELQIVPFDGKVHALKYNGYFKTANNAIYHTDLPINENGAVYKAIINNSMELTFKDPQSISVPKTMNEITNKEVKNLTVTVDIRQDGFVFTIFDIGTFTFQINEQIPTLTEYTIGDDTYTNNNPAVHCTVLNGTFTIKGLFIFDIILTDFSGSTLVYNVPFTRYITNNRIHIAYNTVDCFIDYASNTIESALCLSNVATNDYKPLFSYMANALFISNVFSINMGAQTAPLSIQFSAPDIGQSASNSIMFNVNVNVAGIMLMYGAQTYLFRQNVNRTDLTKTGYTLDGNVSIYMDIFKSTGSLATIKCNLFGFVFTVYDYNPTFTNGRMYIDFNLDIVNGKYYLYNIGESTNETVFSTYGGNFNKIYPALVTGLGNTTLTRGDYISVDIAQNAKLYNGIIANINISDIEGSNTSKNFNITIQGVTKTLVVSNSENDLNTFTDLNNGVEITFIDDIYYYFDNVLPNDVIYSISRLDSITYTLLVNDKLTSIVIDDTQVFENNNGSITIKNLLKISGLDVTFTQKPTTYMPVAFSPHNLDTEHIDTSNQITITITPIGILNESGFPLSYIIQKDSDAPISLTFQPPAYAQDYTLFKGGPTNGPISLYIYSNYISIQGLLFTPLYYSINLSGIENPNIINVPVKIKKFVNTYFIILPNYFIIYVENTDIALVGANEQINFNLNVALSTIGNNNTVTFSFGYGGQSLTLVINKQMKQINASYSNLSKSLSPDEQIMTISIGERSINYQKLPAEETFIPRCSVYMDNNFYFVIVPDSSNFAIVSGILPYPVYVTDFNTDNCKIVFDFYEKQGNYCLSSFYTECTIANPINVTGVVSDNYPILSATIVNNDGSTTDITSKFSAEVKKSTGKMLNSATYCDKAGRPITLHDYDLLEINYKMGRAETYNPYYENTLSHSLGLRDTPPISGPALQSVQTIYPKYFTNNLLSNPVVYPLLASSTDEYLTMKLSKVTVTDNVPTVVELSGNGTLEVYECKNNYTSLICAPVIGPILPVENTDEVPASAVFCDASGRALKPNELTLIARSATVNTTLELTSYRFKHALGFGDSYTTIEAFPATITGGIGGGEIIGTAPETIHDVPHYIITGSPDTHIITGLMTQPNFGNTGNGGEYTINYMQYTGPYYKVIEIENSIIPYNFTNPPVAREPYPNPLYELSNAIYRYSINTALRKSDFEVSLMPVVTELYIDDNVYESAEIKKAVSMFFNKELELWLKIKPLSEFNDDNLIYGFEAFDRASMAIYFFDSNNDILDDPVIINSSRNYNEIVYAGGNAHYKVVAVNKLDPAVFHKRLPSRPGLIAKTNDMVLTANKIAGSNNEIMAYDGAVGINVYGDNNKSTNIKHTNIAGKENYANSVYYSSVDGRNNAASNSVKLTIKGDYNQVDNDYNQMTALTNSLRNGVSDNILIDLKRLSPIEWFGIGQAEPWQRYVFIDNTFKITTTNDGFYQFSTHAKYRVDLFINELNYIFNKIKNVITKLESPLTNKSAEVIEDEKNDIYDVITDIGNRPYISLYIDNTPILSLTFTDNLTTEELDSKTKNLRSIYDNILNTLKTSVFNINQIVKYNFAPADITLILRSIEYLGLKYPSVILTADNILDVRDSLYLLCENKVCLVHFIMDYAPSVHFTARGVNNTQSDDQALLTNLADLLNNEVFEGACPDLQVTRSLVEYYLHKRFSYYFTSAQMDKFTDFVDEFLKSINEVKLSDAISGIVAISPATPKLEQAYKINLIYTVIKGYTDLYTETYDTIRYNDSLLMKINSIYGNSNVTNNTSAQITGDDNNVIKSKTAIVSGGCNIINESDYCIINGVKNKIYQSAGTQIMGRSNKLSDGMSINLLGNDSNVTGCESASLYGDYNNVSQCEVTNVVGSNNNVNMAAYCNIDGNYNTVESTSKCAIVGGNNRADLCEHLAIIGENNTVKSLDDVCIIGRGIDLNTATPLIENSPTNVFGFGNSSGNMLIGATNIGNTLNLGAGLIKKTATINESTTLLGLGNGQPYIKIDYNTSQLFITNGAINIMKAAAAGQNIVNVVFPAAVEGFEFTLIFQQPVYLRILAEYAFTLINGGFMPDIPSSTSPFITMHQLETDTYVKKVTFTCLKDGASNYWFCS